MASSARETRSRTQRPVVSWKPSGRAAVCLPGAAIGLGEHADGWLRVLRGPQPGWAAGVWGLGGCLSGGVAGMGVLWRVLETLVFLVVCALISNYGLVISGGTSRGAGGLPGTEFGNQGANAENESSCVEVGCAGACVVDTEPA